MLSVLGAGLLIGLATAGTAVANDQLLGQLLTSSQTQTGSNSVSQDAASSAISVPIGQININAPIRVASDGDNGSVEQSNDSTASSSASNESWGIQGVDQGQWSGQVQDGGAKVEQDQGASQSQAASNRVTQHATSTAVSIPIVQVNVNAPVRVASDGDDGSVRQSNRSSAVSAASNGSVAKHRVDQAQASRQAQDAGPRRGGGTAGRGGGADPTQSQATGQAQAGSNASEQAANAKAVSAPVGQVDVNIPIRVASTFSDGDVVQSNGSAATSSASNESHVRQSVEQELLSAQLRHGRVARALCAPRPGWDKHGYGWSWKHHIGFGDRYGKGKPVEEDQASKQRQWGSNSPFQAATSKAVSVPLVQLNVNVPVRIASDDRACGGGDAGRGDVHQSNASVADSSAANASWATQLVSQVQAVQHQSGLLRA
jgi:hypothetical protein